MNIAREWGPFQEILHLALPLSPYAQGKIQEYTIQCILPKKLRGKLLLNQSHKN